jgi:hypothetical protein
LRAFGGSLSPSATTGKRLSHSFNFTNCNSVKTNVQSVISSPNSSYITCADRPHPQSRKTILEYFLFCCLSHNIITEETEAEHATTTSECNAISDACLFLLCWSGKRRNWRLQFAERRGGIAVVDPQ